MPRRPLRPCAQPGCPTLVERGYCPAHQRGSGHAPEQRRFYSSGYWRRASLAVRAEQPICAACESRPSEHVDHIDGDWRNNARENLRGVCRACHEAVHYGPRPPAVGVDGVPSHWR